jgi:hypothetical protein
LIAVNVTDDAGTIDAYRQQGGFTFPLAMDVLDGVSQGVGQKYGVSACPTNYVLDQTRKVVFRSAGFDEAGIRAALKKLGVG